MRIKMSIAVLPQLKPNGTENKPHGSMRLRSEKVKLALVP